MKQFSKFAFIFCFLTVFAFVPAMVVQAAPSVAPAFQEASVPSLDDLLVTLKNLGGVAMLVAALINVAKNFGWLTDGQAPAASLALNTLALVGLVALQLTGKADTVPGLDQNAGALAAAINAVLALVFQLYIARKSHENVLAGMPVIGESFTGRRAGEGSALEVFTEDREA